LENYFEKEIELRYFEMNKFGEASPTTILTLLEETAADHCYSIGHSLYDLEKQNIGWVLISGIMVMDRYPTYKEKIKIRTWLSSYTSIKGIRENIIYGENGEIIGRAKGVWIFFDIKRRRPIQILDAIKEKWSQYEELSTNHDLSKKIEAGDSLSLIKEFIINRYDVDSYQHVNNIRYLQWLIESIPEEIIDNYFLHSIDGRFVAEAKYGDTIISFTEKDENENSFLCSIKNKKDNKVCASAKTIWKQRENL
jgi:acyl-ACP thioesterase